ncbi:hypothetical protein HanIR_Chr06g0268661 [Helianthus annuus]|nr:hypothetical protein HanIR_Chr06g0268661 [Helianthus annuus]
MSLIWKAKQCNAFYVKLRYLLNVVSAAIWVVVLIVTFSHFDGYCLLATKHFCCGIVSISFYNAHDVVVSGTDIRLFVSIHLFFVVYNSIII